MSLGWAAGLVAVVLAVFTPVVLGHRTLVHGDVGQLYQPLRGLVVEALRAGRLPLWNPYAAAGKALFAEGVHGVLHPISLLGALIAPERVDFLLLAYLVCAAVGAAALARTLGCSRAASAGAGCAYALAGFTVSMTGNLVFLAGAATVPWTVAALRRCGRGDRPLAVAGAGAAVAACLLSGDVQVALLGTLLGVALAADEGGWRGALRGSIAAAAGAAAAGVQLAASWGELAVTYRGIGLTAADARSWALSPWRLVELFSPGFFRGDLGKDFAPVFFALDPASAAAERVVPFADSVFVGASVLALAALARRGRTAAILAGAAALATWLALGHHAGARQALAAVPIWSSFRYSEKLVGLLTLCLAVLAAMGLDRVARDGLSPAARAGLGAALAATLGVAIAVRIGPELAGAPFRAAGAPGEAVREAVRHLAAGIPHAALALALLLAGGLAPAGLRPGLLAVALALPAMLATQHARLLDDPALLEIRAPPLTAASPGPRVGRVEAAYVVDPATAADHRTLVALARRSALPATNVAVRLDAIDDYSGFDSRRYTNLLRSFGEAFPVLARRYGTTHVAVVGREASPAMAVRSAAALEGGRSVFRDAALDLELWEVPHRPWASFAGSAVAASRPAEARDRLAELHAAGALDAVVVEAEAAPACAPGRVLAVDRAAERLRVEAESDGDALLVIADAWWPGWTATVDGQAAPILPCDVLGRAVRWPQGRHVLEMRYDPPEVRVGWAISAAGAAALVTAAVHGVVQARRRRARSAGAGPEARAA